MDRLLCIKGKINILQYALRLLDKCHEKNKKIKGFEKYNSLYTSKKGNFGQRRSILTFMQTKLALIE